MRGEAFILMWIPKGAVVIRGQRLFEVLPYIYNINVSENLDDAQLFFLLTCNFLIMISGLFWKNIF